MSCFGSNSSVERSFSTLTLVLSDQRLGLSHRNMENVLILKGNNKNWSERERNKMVEAAVASYLQKRRKRKFAPERQEMNSESEIEMNSESEIESHPSSDSESLNLIIIRVFS